jgi:hypothetical protein
VLVKATGCDDVLSLGDRATILFLNGWEVRRWPLLWPRRSLIGHE